MLTSSHEPFTVTPSSDWKYRLKIIEQESIAETGKTLMEYLKDRDENVENNISPREN